MAWARGGISPPARVGGCGGAFELSPALGAWSSPHWEGQEFYRPFMTRGDTRVGSVRDAPMGLECTRVYLTRFAVGHIPASPPQRQVGLTRATA